MHQWSEQPSFLQVSVAIEPPCLFLGLRGELDLCSARDVPLDGYPGRPDLSTVLVDLGGLTFCDGSGLRTLLKLRAIHEAQGRSVVVDRATPSLWRLMRLCGITHRLEFARTVAGAPV